MNTLAFHGGPGPWILFLPLIWAAVVVGVLTVLRRTVRPGGRGGRRAGGPPGPCWRTGPAHDEQSPVTLLGRRFASGEIDEDEYWRRLSVLDEQFGLTGRGGPV